MWQVPTWQKQTERQTERKTERQTDSVLLYRLKKSKDQTLREEVSTAEDSAQSTS